MQEPAQTQFDNFEISPKINTVSPRMNFAAPKKEGERKMKKIRKESKSNFS